jgi:hypothetical protein
MSCKRRNYVCSLFSLFLIFCLCVPLVISAQAGSYVLEAEQHWETYGVGGTCVHGTHSFFVADVDGDGFAEMVAGGFMYNEINGSMSPFEAPLQIWSWNGQNLTLEKNQEWAGNIECVYAGDADGDGVNEILTAGMFNNATGTYSSLRVWRWNGKELSLVTHYEGVWANDIFVNDVDKDGVPEIITVGRLDSDSQSTNRLCLWHLEQNSLILKEALKLNAANVTSATSVYSEDLDADGKAEIVTAGYSDNLNNSKGQLCVWQWNGEELTLKANERWQKVANCYALNIAGGILGNTIVNNLKVGDIDGDGIPEIVTGGFTYDGEKVNAQIRIWNWNGSALTQENSQEWTTNSLTEVMCVSLDDVDSDSRTDIVTGGMVATYGSFANNSASPNQAQLDVWNWDGTKMTLKYNKDWTIGQGVCVWNVGTSDLDKDGTVEIVSIGCMAFNNLCDPDMRIWSVQQTSAEPSYLPFVVAGIIATILVSAAILLMLKKRR